MYASNALIWPCSCLSKPSSMIFHVTSHLISALAVAKIDLNQSFSHCKFIHYFSFLQSIYSLLCTFRLEAPINKKLFKFSDGCIYIKFKSFIKSATSSPLLFFKSNLCHIKTSLGKMIIDGFAHYHQLQGNSVYHQLLVVI